MTRICSSDFRTAVTIAAKTESPDGAGGVQIAWLDIFTVHGSVKQSSGREEFAQEQLAPSKVFKITCRYDSRITEEHRAAFNGRVANIIDATEVDGRFEYMVLTCEEGSGE